MILRRAAVCTSRALLVAGLLACATSAQARAAERRPAILVVFVDDSSQSWVHDMTDGFSRAAFREGTNAPILYYEYLDTVRFDEPGSRARQRTILKQKYEERSLDLVVAVTPNAIGFVDEFRDELWPGVPALFASYSAPIPSAVVARPKSFGLQFEWGFDRALATMKRILPDTAEVVLVGGSAEVERVRQSRNARAVREAGLGAVDLGGLSTRDTLARVGGLPAHSLVFIAGGQVDADGNVVPTWPLCGLVSNAANRPTFMLGAQFLGCGCVGGLMRDFVKIGDTLGARAVAAVQRPAPSGGIESVPFRDISTTAFDARQLERWHIDESQLPPGSDIRFRTPSLWREHRTLIILVVAVGLVQFGLIAGLVVTHRARRRAELEQRHLLSIGAHADRQLAMGELASAIAHELNQPLGAIQMNVETAQKLLGTDRGTPGELREILSDVHREGSRAAQIIERQREMLRKHEMERAPLALNDVVTEAIATVAHHALKHRVRIDAELPANPCVVNADRILLQQVVVNLLVNAIDAMATTPPPQRRVVISVARHGHAVELSVQDRGQGIAPDVLARLFDAFVTTKPKGMGIGLAIVRGIVEAHGGRIRATNNRGGGATFWLTLPAAASGTASRADTARSRIA